MPLEAAAVYFMIGTCYTELNNLNGALDAFNNAIKVNPDYAEVRDCHSCIIELLQLTSQDVFIGNIRQEIENSLL